MEKIIEELKREVPKLRTRLAVERFLKQRNISYQVDKEMIETAINNRTPKTKAIDLKLFNGKVRIYYSNYEKSYIVQTMRKIEIVPNGKKRKIPICYGYTTEIDDYDIIEKEW